MSMNALAQTLNEAAAMWWLFVLHVTWQASLLAALLVIVVLCGRRRASPLRYWLLMLALVKFALPPMLSLPMGLFSNVGPEVGAPAANQLASIVGPLELAPDRNADATNVFAQNPIQQSVSTAAPTSPPVPGPAPAEALDATVWLMLLHLLGAVAMAAWIVRELQALHGVLRRAAEVRSGELHRRFVQLCGQLGLRQVPRLVLTAELSGPAAFGVLRPTVLLPEAVATLPASEMEIVLAHELAHHRRGDLWINAIQLALTVIWWFNPLLWVLNSFMRRVREDCCDDLLLTRNLTTGPAYCETLLHAASVVTGPSAVGVTLGFGARLHSLGRRFERLMDGTLRRTARLSLAGGLFVIALAALVLPGLHRSIGSETVQETRPAESPAPVTSNVPQQPETKDAVVIAGRVLDPNGKPFSGAKLYAMVKSSMLQDPKLKDPNTKIFETKTVDGKIEVYIVHPGFIAIMKKHGLDPARPVTQDMFEKPEIFAEVQQLRQELYEENSYQIPTVRATSGPDGRFRFLLAKSSLHKPPHDDVDVYAFANNFGPGWAWVSKDEELADLTVHLVEDTPINGRIIDLQGRPVAGVTVKLGTIMAGPDGGITMWQDLVKASARRRPHALQ